MTISRWIVSTVAALLMVTSVARAQTPPAPASQGQAAAQAGQKPDPQDQQQKPETYKEVVVVSATKTEQKIVNAPATMTVIGARALEVAPSNNYADIMRSVPGVNVSQLSARDINITSRAATSSLATSQLTILDGRTLYQDFFGFTMWDFMPVNLDEIKRIEIIRGPASAIWGANALNGVVNVLTKSPRENPGTTFAAGFGGFPTDVAGHPGGTGWLSYVNGSHATAVNDKWAYRVSAGFLTQDALPRPTGVIPDSPTNQPYPPFTNEGTSQPKFDARFDYDAPDHSYTMSFAGGFAGTSGMMYSGIGPFSIDKGSAMSYGKWNYDRGAKHLQAFLNILNGDARNLLTVGPDGKPILLSFNTKTFDAEYGDTKVMGPHHVLTYGGNLRLNHFDLTIAPAENQRTEGGGYIQDDIFLNDHFRLAAGARLDKFSSIDNAVFSPRVSFLAKANDDNTFRVSYNRAFRSPSMINNNLQVTIANPLPLTGSLAPLAPFFGGASAYLVPTDALGNPGLTEEHLDAFEVSYTGIIQTRTVVTVATYINKLSNEILFTQQSVWPLAPPPPGWPAAIAPVWAAVQNTAQFPKSFTYLNLGQETNKGLELGVESSFMNGVGIFANYSFQADPDVNFDPAETNHPSKHRFNFGTSYVDRHWLLSMSVQAASSAFWQDVLDSRFHGTTAAFTMVNAGVGYKFVNGKYTLNFRMTNMLNQEIQQHVFGDVLKRQASVELRVRLPK
jgi:outer membrane receptor protein involved in Fe transport